jgi:hypothetical protein
MKYSTFLLKITLLISAASIPATTHADQGDIQDISDLISELGSLVNLTIPVVTGIAVLGFFWGLAQYIFKAGDKEAKEEGRRIMVAGIIGLFLITAIGGIIQLLAESFGVGGSTQIPVPSVGVGSS